MLSVRPNLDVEFFTAPDPIVQLREEYLSSGRICDIQILYSDDRLTRTVLTIFQSEEIFLEYLKKPQLKNMFRIRKNHNETNDIVEIITITDQEGNPYYLDKDR
jgi:hypothetical protein